MNYLIKQANVLLQKQSFSYAFCGGWAIDLFIGSETRTHSDIDIFAYWSDRNAIIVYMQSLGFVVYEMLGGGKAHCITDVNDQKKVKRNIFCWQIAIASCNSFQNSNKSMVSCFSGRRREGVART